MYVYIYVYVYVFHFNNDTIIVVKEIHNYLDYTLSDNEIIFKQTVLLFIIVGNSNTKMIVKWLEIVSN